MIFYNNDFFCALASKERAEIMMSGGEDQIRAGGKRRSRLLGRSASWTATHTDNGNPGEISEQLQQ
jgi:hypothetical protein